MPGMSIAELDANRLKPSFTGEENTNRVLLVGQTGGVLSDEIEIYAENQGLNFPGKVPYDALFNKSMVQHKTIIEHDPSCATCRVVADIWDRVIQAPEMNVLQHYEFN